MHRPLAWHVTVSKPSFLLSPQVNVGTCKGIDWTGLRKRGGRSRVLLRLATEPPLRMEDVCQVGRKRDPVSGNIQGHVYVVGDNIDTDVSFS